MSAMEMRCDGHSASPGRPYFSYHAIIPVLYVSAFSHCLVQRYPLLALSLSRATRAALRSSIRYSRCPVKRICPAIARAIDLARAASVSHTQPSRHRWLRNALVGSCMFHRSSVGAPHAQDDSVLGRNPQQQRLGGHAGVHLRAPHEWQLPTRWPPQPVPLQCCERGFSLQGQGQSSIAFFGVTM